MIIPPLAASSQHLSTGRTGAARGGCLAVRKTMAVMVAAGSLLLGIAAASPALAKTAPLTQLCSPGTNGGTLVNGVCVLPNVNVGQSAEEFILTSNGAVNTFTIVSGSLPPGMTM